MIAPYSLTRRLTFRVLTLVALGWLAAAAGALWVLDHETGETLDDALRHEAQLLARLPDMGAAGATVDVGEDRTMRIASPAAPPRLWPAPPPGRDLWTGNGWVVARAPIPDGRSLELGEKLETRRQEIAESFRGLLLVMVPVALAVMWVMRRTLGQALRPVRQLSVTLARREAEDLSQLDVAGLPTELAPVAGSLNRYLCRIAGFLTAERDFAAHAAHELRTPVAAARAEAQLLASRSGPQSEAAARRIVAALDRITALSERLLQLSRAESGVGLARVPVDLAQLVPLVLDDARPATGQPVSYDDGDLDRAEVQGDVDGIAIMIRNLVENAQIHGTGAVRVTLSAGPRLTIINPARRGAQFRMGRLDRDPLSNGTGLGLTIAAKLADQSGARLSTTVADGMATAMLDWS